MQNTWPRNFPKIPKKFLQYSRPWPKPFSIVWIGSAFFSNLRFWLKEKLFNKLSVSFFRKKIYRKGLWAASYCIFPKSTCTIFFEKLKDYWPIKNVEVFKCKNCRPAHIHCLKQGRVQNFSILFWAVNFQPRPRCNFKNT